MYFIQQWGPNNFHHNIFALVFADVLILSKFSWCAPVNPWSFLRNCIKAFRIYLTKKEWRASPHQHFAQSSETFVSIFFFCLFFVFCFFETKRNDTGEQRDWISFTPWNTPYLLRNLIASIAQTPSFWLFVPVLIIEKDRGMHAVHFTPENHLITGR